MNSVSVYPDTLPPRFSPVGQSPRAAPWSQPKMDLQKSWASAWPQRPWARTAGRETRPVGNWVLPEHAGEKLFQVEDTVINFVSLTASLLSFASSSFISLNPRLVKFFYSAPNSKYFRSGDLMVFDITTQPCFCGTKPIVGIMQSNTHTKF